MKIPDRSPMEYSFMQSVRSRVELGDNEGDVYFHYRCGLLLMIIVHEFTRVGARLRSIDSTAEYHICDDYSVRVDTLIRQMLRIPASDITGTCRVVLCSRVYASLYAYGSTSRAWVLWSRGPI